MAAPSVTGPLFAEGLVGGSTVQAGAQVHLEWLPGAATAVKGDTIKPVVLSKGVTNAGGRFKLGLSPSPVVLAEIATNDKWLNVDLVVKTKSGFQTRRAISRLWNGTRWANQPDRPAQDAEKTVHFSLPATGTQSTTDNWQNTGSPDASEFPFCYFTVDYVSVDSTRIISFHSSANAQGKWEYGKTADSDIDVGVAKAGGSWGVSGSVHIGGTSSALMSGTAKYYHYNSYVRTDFNYTHGRYVCDGITTDYKVYASLWRAGARDDGQYPRTSCAASPHRSYFARGQSFYRGSERASRIGFALDVGPVNLGQTSGHSVSVDMSWTDIRNNGIYLCGNNGPATTSGVVYASDH